MAIFYIAILFVVFLILAAADLKNKEPIDIGLNTFISILVAYLYLILELYLKL